MEDAVRLRQCFDARNETTSNGKLISQMEFGAKYEIGSQGMVWQYLNGHRPLNIKAAVAFARGLGLKVSDFSPTLAAQIGEASEVELGSSDLHIVGQEGPQQLQWVTPDEAELLSAFRLGTPADQERTLLLVKSFARATSSKTAVDKAQ